MQQVTQNLASNFSPGGTGIPLPRLSNESEKRQDFESQSGLLMNSTLVPISVSKAFVPLKLKIRRFLTLLLWVKTRNKNFI